MAAPSDEELDGIIFGGRSSGDQPGVEVLMEQYRLFVETSERLVARRQVVNTFFLSANALALSALGLIAKEVSHSPLAAIGIVAVSAAALLLCVAWKRLVRSYAQLNGGKCAVIERLERRLPAALFSAEWVALGKGKDPKVYKPFTATEQLVSVIFIVLYGLAALFTVGWIAASYS
ncbi:MAG: hypothetical protein OXG82_00210 [Gammaproteobacteria bacterium]|nr:hypothetical protein [Gammaproteobacteria bacterium]